MYTTRCNRHHNESQTRVFAKPIYIYGLPTTNIYPEVTDKYDRYDKGFCPKAISRKS